MSKDLANAIAVVGMAGRFPGARTLDEYWRNLRDGVDSVRFLTEDELRALGVSRALLEDPSYVRATAQPPDLDRFDATFFGINHREAEILDPQQRVFLESCWEALEDAGYDPDALGSTVTGVFGGQTTSTYLLFNLMSNAALLATMDPLQLLVGNAGDSLATRVSYKLNLKGPSYTVQSACSTSAVAVHTACQSLLNGECDLALAGGVSINVHLLTGYRSSEGSVFAKGGKCRAFDAGAEGILFGGGSGVVVLKRAEDALRDGDNIQALILGSAVNNDGALKVGYTAPSVDGQAEVIAEAWAASGAEMESASYIEAHGTGTRLGDPIEVQALTKAFRPETDKKQFIPLGSVKTNIGHLDVAAGVAGLIKTVLALKNRQIPPTLHFEEPNPEIDFASSPVFVNTRLRPWEGSERRAGVSSFGFGGTNVHLVLEEAPEVPVTSSPQDLFFLPLSAKSEAALEEATRKLAEHLERHPELDIADVAWTLQVGRRSFEHRRIVACRTREEAIAALESLDPSRVWTSSPPYLEARERAQHAAPLHPPIHPEAARWLGGEEGVDWRSLYAGESRRRVSLPTYPFERRRYWIAAASGIDAPGTTVAEAPVCAVPESPSAVLAMAAGAVQTFHPRPSLFNPYEAARDEREEKVCRIWQEVLGVEPVGVHDDFFQLGGHSLLATQVLSRVRDAFGVDFPLQHLFSFPTAAELAEAIRYLQEEAVGEQTAEDGRIPPSPLRETGGPYPLSFPQERLWFLDQFEPGTPAFNIPAAVRLRGRLDVPVLRWSLDQVIARHESLRTRFKAEGEGAVQEVLPPFSLPVPVADLAGLPPGLREAEERRLILDESSYRFRISGGPLLRALLVRQAPGEHLLILIIHHIVSDGWSMGVFQGDLARFYRGGRAALSGEPPVLPGLPIQYADFADWQRHWFTGEVLERQLAYWRPRLAGLPYLELRGDRPRPPVQTYRGGYEDFQLPSPLARGLEEVARNAGASLYMVLLTAFETLLGRYSGQDDFAVGTYIANRNRAEVERLVGFFINDLPLRADLSGDPLFRDLLVRVRETTLEAFAHQDMPFEKLLEELRPERDMSRGAIVQALFNLLNFPAVHEELPGLTLSGSGVRNDRANFDVTLWMAEGTDGLVGWLEYNADLFDRSTARRMAGNLQRLLEGIAADPDRKVSELPFLSDAERRQLLADWSQRPGLAAPEVRIHDLFRRQAAATPDAPAVEHGSERLTYAELARRAGVLARRLRRLGVGPEVPVALFLERSPEMIVAIFGTLEAGGFYVPLDPATARERLAYAIENAGIPVLLTQERLLATLPPHGARVLVMDGPEMPEDDDASASALPSLPDSLVYAIYTSGSTGAPKGVAISHRSLVGYCAPFAEDFGIGPGDRVLQFASLSFDTSAEEIFPCLIRGGTLVLRNEEMMASTEQFLRACGDWRITVLDLPTAYWHLLAVEMEPGSLPEPVRLVITGGEQVLVERLRSWNLATGGRPRLVNTYGPTEGTITATECDLSNPQDDRDDRDDRDVPIGRAMPNSRIYVLDARLSPVPAGAPGELCIGGRAVARGYLGRPDLTAGKFLPDPFAELPGARLYRTGDLSRWRPDGLLEFLGRIDHQVKIRGFRIELGEIEAALSEHPAVAEAAVLAPEVQPGDRRLVAYVVAREGSPLPDLRDALRGRVPDYMVPSLIVELSGMPMTVSGKVDRRALPAPDWSRTGEGEGFVPPRTPVEQRLAEIWKGVLRIERAGAFDSFFDLGGHSLLATQLVSRVRQGFGVDLPLRSLFEAPTLAEQALVVEEMMLEGMIGDAPAPAIPRRASASSSAPLSFAQERLWFLDRLEPGSPLYNISTGLRMSGLLDTSALRRAVAEIVLRHEALRTSFEERGGVLFQRVSPAFIPPLPVVDLRALTATSRTSRDAEARRVIAGLSDLPFDLSRGPLLRSTLLRLAEEEWSGLFTVHHIAGDAWSIGVLIRETTVLYEAFCQGRPSPLPGLPIQFADYALWQRGRLQGGELQAQLSYWRGELAGAPVLLELPTDRPRPAAQAFRGAAVPVAIPAELAGRLRDLGRRHGVTLFMTLLASFQALLHRYTGQDDILVGSPIAGRTEPEVEGLIGLFVNMLVLRGRFGGGGLEGPRFGELLEQVKSAALGAYAHQDLPFERLVEELGVERSLGHNPMFQVVFALQNVPRGELSLPDLRLSALEVGTTTSKFDLSLSLSEVDGGLVGSLEYATNLFEAATAQRMVERLLVLLEGIGPGLRVWELPLLTPADSLQALAGSPEPREQGACIHELFEEQAARRPGAAALRFQGGEMSYAELDARADGLARVLRQAGTGPDVLVGVFLERSPDAIVAILAVLKAGGAYVPLDPSYPAERLALLLEDSAVPVLLTRRELLSRLPEMEARAICLDEEVPRSGVGGAGGDQSAQPGSLAYVMYTSGSTGRPKGVAVTHRNVARLVRETDFARFGEDEVFLQLAPISFDASTLEIWGPLLNGGTLVVFPPHTPTLEELGEVLVSEGITTLWLTAGLFHPMVETQLESLRGLRQLLAGGDVLSPPHVRKALAAGLTLINGYGPTENTTFTCCHPMRSAEGIGSSVPIGRPIAGTRVHLLDRNLRPVPPGVPGELCTGGEGLARGYLSRPDLTAERFVPDPLGGAGERLYRTGDLARLRPTGEIEFRGRIDQQVKIRGFRIEPGEIEAALVSHPAVSAAAVLAVAAQGQDDKRLAAFLVAPAEVETEVRSFLRDRLPEPMIPSAWIFLEALPLSPNGKVDRRALARIEPVRARAELPQAPLKATEELLVGLWAEVLGREVGVREHFFEAGGHSLLATRLASRVREVFGVELPLRTLFEAPVLGDLAARIDERMRNAGGAAPPILPTHAGHGPLSFAQERLWLLDRLEPGSAAHNVPAALRLSGALDPPVLERSLGEIVRRHQTLRTTFREIGGEPVQVVHPAWTPSLPEIDLRSLREAEREAEAGRIGREEAARPFDLASGPLLRASLVRMDGQGWVLLLNLHPIVCDSRSMGMLVRESTALYEADSTLPELPVQYIDYAVWQRSWMRDEVLESQLRYWREELAGAPALLELPTDRPRPPAQSYRGASEPLSLPADLAQALVRLSRRERATLFMVLLAAFQALLHRYTGQEDVLVGSPVANRGRAGIEGLIGLFANTLVLRGRFTAGSTDPTFRGLLGRVRATTLRAYVHQDLPFERLVEELVEELDVERSPAHSPLFQAMLAWHDTPAASVSLAGLTVEPLDLPAGATRFDLMLSLAETADGGIAGSLDYATDLFDAPTARRLLDHYRHLLEAVVAAPAERIADLPLMGDERRQVLADWNGSVAGRQAPPTILEARLAERERRVAALRARIPDGRLAAIEDFQSPASPAAETIPRRSGAGPAPLSFSQERLWFLDRLQGGHSSYNIPAALSMDGRLEVALLARALDEVIRRHEALRTTFAEREGTPFQVIAPPFALALPVVDLRAFPAERSEVETRRLAAAEAARPFDLVRGPLLRSTLLRLGAQRWVVLLNMHHIVSDQWSLEVLVRECTALYQAFSHGRSSPLPELPIQYPDFAVWQRGWLRGETLERQLSYWKRELEGVPALLELPTDRPRPPVQTFRGSILRATLPAELTGALRRLGHDQHGQHDRNTTLFMILMAALQALLGRFAGQDDVLVGSPIANRNRLEVEGLIGFFVNTLVLRGRLDEVSSFRGLLERVRRSALDAYAHQDLPFEKLVEDLQVPRSLSYNPLFQVMFALQNAQVGTIELPGLTVSPFEFEIVSSNFDLGFQVVEEEGALRMNLEYSTDLFDATTIRRLADRFQLLLEGAAADPERSLSALPLLSEAERHQLLREWADSRAARPTTALAHRLFEEQAARTPEAIAVVHEGRSLSYREIESRANGIAAKLRTQGIGPESRVGLFVERTPELIAAILGIWKAGGAYVPLDPSLPEARIAYMVEDAGIRVVLDEKVIQSIPNTEDQEDQGVGAQHAAPSNLAYLIYTSGTTGQPKAVLVEHGNLAHTLRASREAFAFSPGDRMPCLAPFSFDIFLFELLGPLLSGGTSVLFGLRPTLDVPALAESLDGMTLLHAVPALMRQVVEWRRSHGGPARSLRRVFVGGDAVPPDLLADMREVFPEARITVLYGPTEATIIASRYEADGREDRNVLGRPLGRPLLDAEARVVDRFGMASPIGVPGELWLAGPGVTRGYLGRDELTAEKFVEREGRRWYRTGDLARWLADGNLEFLGRVDQQVKVRGFRIELGEIEARLADHPAVREAVVLALGEGGEKSLVAYVVPGVSADLKAFLRESLPEYMIPSAWVFLEEIPVTSHGKVDRKALARIEQAAKAEDRASLHTPTEELLAGIWSGLLGVAEAGADSDFFNLGGHSLLATRLASRVRETFGVDLPLRVFFEASVLAEMARRIDAGGRPASAPIARRAGGEPAASAAPAAPAALSFAQERLWFLDRLAPGSPLYNMPAALRLAGPVEVGALEAALREVVRRHEVLRTTFREIAGEPRQVVSDVAFRLPVVDLRSLPPETRQEESRRLAGREALRPFDLQLGPLVRATLLRLEEEEWTALFNLHHIVADGWSFGVLVDELAAFYDAASPLPPLPALPIQYADFAVWQREWLRGEVLEAQLSYWRLELKGAPHVLELPLDRPRPAMQTFHGSQEKAALPGGLVADLNALARREGVTLFMALLAAFQALLSRYTHQEDLLVGSPVAGRNRAELEGLIGFFVNTLVLRGWLWSDEADGPAFRELLARTRGSALGAYAHQDLPFERLVEELQVERSLTHGPLVQVNFALQNVPAGTRALTGLTLEPLPPDGGTAKFDLALSLVEAGGGLSGTIEYSTDLFDRSTILRFLGHFERLLAAVVEDPGRRLAELPLLSQAELRQVQVEWNLTGADSLADPVHRLFAVRAGEHPDAPAVVSGGCGGGGGGGGGERETLTYGKLERRANRLAHRLRRLGVGAETVVAIRIQRSPELVTAALGVLKAGGAYLPIDPAHPAERLAYTLRDSGARLLLTTRLLDLPGLPVESIQVDGELFPGESEAPVSGGFPEQLAYVIYTSGSTGEPKGTELTHAGLSNLAAWHRRLYSPGPEDRTTLLAGPGFDASVWEIWPALTSGASLHVPPGETVASPPELLAWLAERRITQSFLPTPLAEAVLAEMDSGVPDELELRVVLTGGDRLHRRPPGGVPFVLVNHYGPTEGTVVTTAVPVGPAGDRPPSIGRAIANVRVHLLDRSLRPVPVGVPGELCVAGAGLSRGYRGRPDLTAERFVPDPFGRSGQRLYRTGDLARWLPDGEIEFLGRLDHQVKIRGIRIELGEIEAVLGRHPDVREAVVLARDGRLVAYVVGEASQDAPDALRAHFAERLPAAMIPAAWIFLDALPLTPNGKVDRGALASIEPSALARGDVAATRTATEEVLAGIWAGLLRVERVGSQDNFFDLGGHSLLATRLASRVRDVFGIAMPVRVLFEAPRLAEFALRIDTAQGGGFAPPPIERVDRQGPFPLSFAQERLWFLDRMEPGGALYSVPAALRVDGTPDVPALQAALDGIVRRHEALRTTFHQEDGEPWQRIEPEMRIPLSVVDLSQFPERVEKETEALRVVRAEAMRPFDLSRGPLLRMLLLRMDAVEWVLFVNLHHIASDGWSIGVFVRELGVLYSGGELPELPVQYPDFAVWQRRWLSGEVVETQVAWWKEELAGASTHLELPTDRPRPPVQTFRGATRPAALPADLSGGVRALAREEGATLFMTLLAGFQALLHRYTGQADILVGSPVANRVRPEVEGLIGLFVNAVTLRGRLGGGPSFRELLHRVRASALGAYAHQDLPFERLVQELQIERSLARHPVYQAVFSLQNAPAEALELPGMTLTPLPADSGTAKLDLLLSFAEEGPVLVGGWEFSTDLFDDATIGRMSGHLRTLLAAAVAEPDRRLPDLPLLTGTETFQVLAEWNDTARPAPADLCLHHLFEASAARNPEAVAATYQGESLTYAGLGAQADRLARRLRSLGIGPESLVGICMERGLDRLVAVVAAFKAGGAYLPLDPTHPRERLAWMLEDSRVGVLVTQESLLDILPETRAEIVTLDGLPEEETVKVEGRAADPDNLAYVIYTSGSTGRPNGVLVTHRTAVHLILQAVEHFQLDSSSRVLQMVSFSFDASVLETWMALAAGATLCISRRETRMSGEAVAEMIRREGITSAVLTPAVLGTLPHEGLPSLRVVSVGGDSCPGEVATRWAPPASGLDRLLNCYGPTETTIYTTVLSCRGAYRKEPPIGRPIGNARAWLVDPNGQTVPAGVPGELCIAGAGLARGYLNRPDLTAARFVPDPFAGSGERVYRTGDLARWLPDGNLEFLGRVDRQVKIRGLRIELGEVEAALGSHPAVAESAVFVRDDRDDLDDGAGKRLVACVVSRPETGDAGPDLASQLREHLRGRLPDYMLPGSFLFLESLPLTPTGKLDRQALAHLGEAAGLDGERVEPRDVLELDLARIWAEVLGVPRVGVRDGFFELGGHSLLAVRLLAQVGHRFGRELPLSVLFQGGTVEAMAALLREEATGPASCLVPIQPRGAEPPFFCVHPAGGDVLCYAALARHLGPDRPFYGLQSRGLDGSPPLGSIEAMAALYLEEIRRVQPQGPYRLGGWSLGGLIAFEMARQLRAAGEEVALLALLDSSPEIAGMVGRGEGLDNDAGFLADMAAYVENLWGKKVGIDRAGLEGLDPESQMRCLLERLRDADFLPPGAGLEQVRRTLEVYKANARAAGLYEPQLLDAQVTAFRAAEGDETRLGWDRLTPEPVVVVPVPGHHLSLLAEPNVRTLAERLRSSLQGTPVMEEVR